MKMFLTAAVLALATVGAAQAEVIDAQANGFQVKRTISVNAPAARVYQALVTPGSWWNHTYSGSSANMRIEAKAGGCWCETLPKSKGEVAHMRVVYVDPPSMIRFEGSLGPLQQTGAGGHMTWSLAAKGETTELTWTYDVGGYMKGGLAPFAPAVDGVFAEQLGRVKKLVETGKAD